MEIITQKFEKYQAQEIKKVTLKNDCGVAISCLSMGATWYEFLVPDKDGNKHNLIMNFAHCADYYSNGLCCCQSIGRVAGRIKKGHFKLNQQEVQLLPNENGNTLHGGNHGFRFLNWKITTQKEHNSVSAIFSNKISEKIDGFPGDLDVEIKYTLNNQNQVMILYTAKCGSESTLFNPTCHAYFNLSDQPNLASHKLKINSTQYLELDTELIPTGNMLAVENTPYDFRDFQNLESAISKNNGFDDAFVIDEASTNLRPVAVLSEQTSGRAITISSDSNCLVVYTMSQNQPGVKFIRDGGKFAQPSEAVALEAQTLPDAINNDDFGNIVLPANTTKSHEIVFTFTQK
ncbi:aldose epimerase family protein [Lactobacillus sp. ESL0230]|uniref:aldose epimerase family protein n=1 Tax=Lactobacillus sp. ESL0230 TaxID=2069353 RepID=UPI000EFC412E|nr:aldose epimerase family protein [Lactobacillus sp. ESL0230]RMC46632.1 galactose mutarotase [Lactobacillus sp. ESL0230]